MEYYYWCLSPKEPDRNVLCVAREIEGDTGDSLPVKPVGPCNLSGSLLALSHFLEFIALFSVAVTGF